MPPKKKNKNKPNGFYMYMLEKKHEFEAQEGRNLTMADLVPLAHPGWKVMHVHVCVCSYYASHIKTMICSYYSFYGFVM